MNGPSRSKIFSREQVQDGNDEDEGFSGAKVADPSRSPLSLSAPSTNLLTEGPYWSSVTSYQGCAASVAVCIGLGWLDGI